MRNLVSKNFLRILKLAESFSDAPKSGFTKAEVVRRAELPTSTVYRLLSAMEDAGYIYRSPEGGLLPNFSFERRIDSRSISLEKLRSATAMVSAQLQTASEIILRRGHNLLWHITDEHPLQPMRLRAHPSYVRATYELDSISRLALAYCEITDIEQSWDLTSFYDVGIERKRVNWTDARDRIRATDKLAMQFDMLGNSKGVRRYCVAITDRDEEFVCLLTAAEAATPVRDEAAHVTRIRAVLTEVKSFLIGDDTFANDQGDSMRIVHPEPNGHLPPDH